MRNLALFFILMLWIGSCQISVENDEETPLITRNDPVLTSDIMTPEVLWSFGRLSDVQVSPDGEKILYGVSYYNIGQNKSNQELFLMNTDGTGKIQLTETPQNEFNAIWHPDGDRIIYLSPSIR